MNANANPVAAAVTAPVAAPEVAAPENERFHSFKRVYGDFSGAITLLPADELKAKGVTSKLYDASTFAGFAGLNKSCRILLSRAVGDMLCQKFIAVQAATKTQEGGTIQQAEEAMLALFASIRDNTLLFGRSGEESSTVHLVARTAALLVAIRYSLSSAPEAFAHPAYAPFFAKISQWGAEAAVLDKQREDKEGEMEVLAAQVAQHWAKIDDASTAEEKASAEAAADAASANVAAIAAEIAQLTHKAGTLRSAYNSLAKREDVSALRAKWFAKKATTPKANVAAKSLADDLLATLGDAPM